MEANFLGLERPCTWPSNLPYPADPTTRLGDRRCASCKSVRICDCDPRSCFLVTNPLIELMNYGSKGTGVRALQHIPKGAFLGEYVGVLWNPKHSARLHDDPYSMRISPTNGLVDQKTFGIISAAKSGNWTRYINHSCRSSTDFYQFPVGNGNRTLVKTRRDIAMFEEITVDYGAEYFSRGNRICLCGEDCCISQVKDEE